MDGSNWSVDILCGFATHIPSSLFFLCSPDTFSRPFSPFFSSFFLLFRGFATLIPSFFGTKYFILVSFLHFFLLLSPAAFSALVLDQ